MKNSDNKFINFILNPSLWLVFTTWAITALLAAGSILCVVFAVNIIAAAVVYAAAAVALTYSVYCLVKTAPTIKLRAKVFVKTHRFTSRLASDYTFRNKIISTISFLINIGFVVFNIVFGFITMYGWYWVLGGYYFLLGVARAWIFRAGRKATLRSHGDKAKLYENRLLLYRNSGIVLFILDLAMAVSMGLMLSYRRPTSYTEVTAIIYATYTFYKVVTSVRNIFRAQKHTDPQIQAFRNIGLADAAISVMSLTIAMISTFSNGASANSMKLLVFILAVTMCLVTVLLGVYMIVSANQRLRKLKGGDDVGDVDLDDALTKYNMTDNSIILSYADIPELPDEEDESSDRSRRGDK